MPHGRVCVAIVTYNSGRYIRRCIDAVLRQEGVPIEVVVVDNSSTDDTCEILKEFKGRIRKFLNNRNLGFAEAQNRAIRASRSEWVLTLNPDVLLLPGFIRRLVEAGESDPGAGAVCGKLLSIGPGFDFLPEPRIDSTGIFFTPAMRHFDRGWHEPDIQCFETMEYVFGASAAAALFRRRMIDDIAVEGSFFDPDFFIYREDADVAWRAQLMGWRCIYTPQATSYHVRTANPENRRSVPAAVNMHSVKNRFLMRIKNATPGLYRRFWLAMTLRDLTVLGGVLFWEPSSLPALWRLAACLPRAWRQRRQIMSRKRVSDEVMAQWFSVEPAALPIDSTPAPIPARRILSPAVSLAGRAT
ncbi:MAG TPA: glycosyltransferase family 2 protein [Bryobacteraceae bacterium]|nr:glycosyltransferase family 2 protein [Bryobacteraceae bacterium]